MAHEAARHLRSQPDLPVAAGCVAGWAIMPSSVNTAFARCPCRVDDRVDDRRQIRQRNVSGAPQRPEQAGANFQDLAASQSA